MRDDLAAPMDNVTRGSTAVTFLVVLLVGWAVTAFVPPPGRWIALSALALTALALGIGYLYRPTGYEWHGDTLLLHRPIGAVGIPRADVVTARKLDRNAWRFLRAFGSGGYFGHFGKFWSKETGFVDFHVTSLRAPLVLIETRAGKKRVISPDPVWVEELMDWLPRTDEDEEAFRGSDDAK